MTRTYAAKRLLEHGPLPFTDFWQITGWQINEAHDTLEQLVREGEVKVRYENNRFGATYALAKS